MQDSPQQRVVAIVGRPNVGKSAIFNRLVGRRVAIVHAQSGVTRDRLMHDADWGGQRFDLVDTGGVCNVDGAVSPDVIERGVRSQVDVALQDACMAILTVDVQAGMHPLDREVAGILRSRGCLALVAANKADNEAADADAVDFGRLGLPVFPVSALHNRGFDALMDEVCRHLPPAPPETSRTALKVAVVGRPNVGKSSYVNRLLRSDRVIVSEVPGTTRDRVDVPFTVGGGPGARHYVLIDTAGMRRVGKIDSSVERFGRFRAEASIRDASVVVLLLDATQGPSAQDKKIAQVIIEEDRACVVAVNKWDLATVTQRQFGPEIRRIMPFLGHCPLVFLSARTGLNVRRSVEAIDHVAAQFRAALPTGLLNRCILEAYERVKPPSVKGRPLKIFYSTQTGAAPIRIRVFVNNPSFVKPAYRSYLVRLIRERFGLEGAPVRLRFVPRRKIEGHAGA